MKRGTKHIALWLLLAALLALPRPAPVRASRVPPFGGALRLGIPKDFTPKKTDPLLYGRTYEGRLITLLTHNGLYQLNPQGEAVAMLVAGEKISPDGKIWLLTLRQDVMFHSGKLLNAKDVVYTLQRAAMDKTSGPLLSALWGAPRDPAVTAVDPYTVRIVLRRPEPRLRHLLAQPGLFVVQANLEKLGPGSWGTGAFMLAKDKPGVLRAFEGHWGGRPYLNEIRLVEISAPEETLLAFKRQQMDALVLQPAQAAGLKANLTPTSLPQLVSLEFGCSLKPEERRVLAQSAPAADLLKVYFRQKGRTVNSVFEGLGQPKVKFTPPQVREPLLKTLSNMKKRNWVITHHGLCGVTCRDIAHRLAAALESRGLKAAVRPPKAARRYDVMVKTTLPTEKDPLPLLRQETRSLSRCGQTPPVAASAMQVWMQENLVQTTLLATPVYFTLAGPFSTAQPGPYNVVDLENLWTEKTP